ncbi:hypothetical protein AQ611_21055 [Burkholderia singularis]|nr:hypothetical protein AQ611_21055 [Burkholderia sp. Bp7605]
MPAIDFERDAEADVAESRTLAADARTCNCGLNRPFGSAERCGGLGARALTRYRARVLLRSLLRSFARR